MELKIDNNLGNILLGLAVLYVLFITGALGKIGVILSGITYSTFQGIDAMLIVFLIIAALLIYYSSKNKSSSAHGDSHGHH